MRMLSAQDASFIYLESDHTPMHIGGVYLVNSAVAPETFGYASFFAHIKSRLVCSPVFRQRLVEAPLSLSHPCWINDPDFQLKNHLPRLQLPEPGTWQDLMQLCAQLFGQSLVRKRPLWELGFVEGLDHVEGLAPGSFAVISRVHHAAVDGGSGVELMGALMDFGPEPRAINQKDDWQPEAIPATGKMLTAAYSRLGRKSVELGKFLGEIASGAAQSYGARRAAKIDPPPMLLSAPPTVLNQAVSSSRTYAALDFDFERIRNLRKLVPGATVNDIVLAVCSGGLRSYLLKRGVLPGKSLVAMAPISVRKDEQKGDMGNQVSAMLVGLGSDIENPLLRLQQICKNTQASKIQSSAIPANKIAEFIPSETLAAAARLYTLTRMGGRHKPFFNVTITNVPGPSVPLYMAGARVDRYFGMAPILDGLGLTIVVLSYAGRLSLGLTSCYTVVPDPDCLAECIAHSLADLENAALGSVSDTASDESGVVHSMTDSDAVNAELNAAERLREASKALDEAMALLEKKISS